MDLHTALLTRRTAHKWQPVAVPEVVIERALEAAHHAPCHKLTWPWRFVRVGPRTRQRLAEIALSSKAGEGLPTDAQREQVRAKLLDAGALVVVARQLDPDPFRAREDYAAVAAAVQNLMLSVHGDGFASKWSTGPITRAAETYEALDLDPGVCEIEGFIWVGVPAAIPEVRRPAWHTVVRQVP